MHILHQNGYVYIIKMYTLHSKNVYAHYENVYVTFKNVHVHVHYKNVYATYLIKCVCYIIKMYM